MVMSRTELNKKIKALVEREADDKKLKKVYALMTKETKAQAIKRYAQEVAKESDADIKAGRVYEWNEVKKELEAMINGLKNSAAANKPRLTRG